VDKSGFSHNSVYCHFLFTRTSLNESFLLGNGETAFAFEDVEEVISMEVIRDLLQVVYVHIVCTFIQTHHSG